MVFEREIDFFKDGAIQEQFKSVATQFDVILGKIHAIISESEITKYQSGNTTMSSKLSDLTLTVDGLTGQFSTLETNFDNLSGDYTSTKSKVTEIEANVDTISGRLSSVETKANTTETNLTKLTADVGGISTEVSTVKTNLQNNYSTTSQMTSAINQSATGIKSEVKEYYVAKSGFTSSVESIIEQNADSIRLKANKISWSSTYSTMTSTGVLTCTSGTIGGWTIGSVTLSSIYNGKITGLQKQGHGTWAITVGATTNENWGTGKFRVNHSGQMYAEGATISGSITATSGTIGGFTIGTSTISNNSVTLDSQGLALKYSGTSVGRIGCNVMAGYSSQRGLEFGLDYASTYMTWCWSESASATVRKMKLSYTPRTAGTEYTAGRLHISTDSDFHNYKAYRFWFDPATGGPSGGAYISSGYVYIPAGIGAGGVVTSYYTFKLKNGVLMSV